MCLEAYAQFNKVYDMRDRDWKLQEVLAEGEYSMDPRKNLGMGVLEVIAASANSFNKLRDFLHIKTTHWATGRADAVDVD